MAYYQRAKDKRTIRDLEEALAQSNEKHAQLMTVISDALEKLRAGVVNDAIALLETASTTRQLESGHAVRQSDSQAHGW